MKRIYLPFLLLLSACTSEPESVAVAPVDKPVQEFEAQRKEGMNAFGLLTIQGEDQNVNTTDCMVFNRAAKAPAPTTLGGLSAWVASLKLRVTLGCVPSHEGITQYETARRTLWQSWEALLAPQVPGVKLSLAESNMGGLVQQQISDVGSETLACRGHKAEDARAKNMSLTLDMADYLCKPDRLNPNTNPKACRTSWSTVYAQSQAKGPRDELSLMAELTARYHMMFLACTPQAPQEYVQFHQSLPKTIFEGPAYRFRIAIDPIMQCSLNDMRARQNKGLSPQSVDMYLECAKRMNVGELYDYNVVPDMFAPSALEGKDEASWIVNPRLVNSQPTRWTLSDCEKKILAHLQASNINVVPPESLKRYCERTSS